MKTLKGMAIFISVMGLAVAGCAFKNGGNAGELQIDIKNSSEFKLEVAQRVGQPGKSGVGGQGTPGGKGGAGGPKDPYCAGGIQGKDGNDGGKGGNGQKGEPGQKALIKHSLQKVEIYDLQRFQAQPARRTRLLAETVLEAGKRLYSKLTGM